MTREIYQVVLALLIADECRDQFSLWIFPSHRSSGALGYSPPPIPQVQTMCSMLMMVIEYLVKKELRCFYCRWTLDRYGDGVNEDESPSSDRDSSMHHLVICASRGTGVVSLFSPRLMNNNSNIFILKTLDLILYRILPDTPTAFLKGLLVTRSIPHFASQRPESVFFCE